MSLGVGTEFTTSNSTSDGYTATGFLNDKLTHPSFAQQFEKVPALPVPLTNKD